MRDINAFQERLTRILDEIELTSSDPSPKTERYNINEEIRTLILDIKTVDNDDIDSATVSAYLDLFITENQPLFPPSMRS